MGNKAVGRFEGWSGRHPWLYGLLYAMPFAVMIVVVQARQRDLDSLRTWAYALLLLAFATVMGYSSSRRRR